ncbi:hypothetical protein BU17DRAFT_85958 [Hysterangium stoloniferum]|nr:hypothetical protein BU17DRAFT_85958 [Hysterangium stoloniferum]
MRIRSQFQLQTFPSTFSFSSSGETPDLGLSTATLSSTRDVGAIVADSTVLDPNRSRDTAELFMFENPMKVNGSSSSEFQTAHEASHSTDVTGGSLFPTEESTVQ